MSRLIVKNLPKEMKEERLRNLFSSRGEVTDCQLKFTAEGKFRKFAFIGFRTAEAAEDARKFFDQSFVDTARVQVELCKPFGDDSKPRPWSKYAKVTPVAKPKVELRPEVLPLNTELPDDPNFKEFLEAQGKEALIEQSEEKKSNKPTKVKEEKFVPFAERDDKFKGSVRELLTNVADESVVLIDGLPAKVKLSSVKQFLAPVKPKMLKAVKVGEESGSTTTSALVSFNRSADKNKTIKRNGEFFGGFRLSIFELSKGEIFGTKMSGGKLREDDGLTAEQKIAARQKHEREMVEVISDTGRLFVRNLSYLCTEGDIESLFKTYGQVTEINMPLDKFTSKAKGFAFVTFMFPEHAVKAYSELDGSVFQGRMLHIIPGKEKPDDHADVVEGNSFKQKKEKELKSAASSAHNWNTLFLGPSAVADVLSKKLEVEKSDILTASGKGSLGVRMALGETQIIRETREFLVSNGVELDSFSQPNAPRSKTVILVKNLPAHTKADEVREVFTKFGNLGRILLPESGVTAIVEFLEAQEARVAFKSLAYRRFKNAPLFLEWAPGEVFSTQTKNERDAEDLDAPVESKSQPEPMNSQMHQESLPISTAKAETSDSDADETDQLEPESTLFVKNLSFDTTDDNLRSVFQRIGPLASVTVARKKDPKNPGCLLSMGYGFVQFRTATDATTALKDLQGTQLDGHSLELKISQRQGRQMPSALAKAQRHKQTDGKQKSTKILVKNVPFQANQKELRELFSTFGELKTVRLPKKLSNDHSHRGFGFVDFVSGADAKKAFKAMCHSTHLYNRRLVLEWAEAEESVEDVRKRTAEHYHTGERKSKQQKKAKILDENPLPM